MKTGRILMNTRPAASNVFGAIVSLVLVTSSAKALTISDGSSSADISPASSAGMFNWKLGSYDPLVQQWFWYRIGGVGAELPINTISAPVLSSLGPNQVTTTYNNGILSVQIDYLLTSASPNQASIQESISVINLSGAPLDLHFFQYSDFDLGPGGDRGALDTNLFGKYNEVVQTNNAVVFTETVAVVTPGADHGELSFFPTLLNKLNDGVATTLSDTPPGTLVGPGDLTWGFQWDRVLTANGLGSSLAISKLKTIEIVPEPSAFAIGLMGLAAVRWMRRRC